MRLSCALCAECRASALVLSERSFAQSSSTSSSPSASQNGSALSAPSSRADDSPAANAARSPTAFAMCQQQANTTRESVADAECERCAKQKSCGCDSETPATPNSNVRQRAAAALASTRTENGATAVARHLPLPQPLPVEPLTRVVRAARQAAAPALHLPAALALNERHVRSWLADRVSHLPHRRLHVAQRVAVGQLERHHLLDHLIHIPIHFRGPERLSAASDSGSLTGRARTRTRT